MKKLLIILGCLSIAQTVYGLDIVYPNYNAVTIAAPSSFFIGSADTDKPLTINGNTVPVHPSGGFAYVVPLSIGKNTFKIKSGTEELNYVIMKPPAPPSGTYKAPEFKEFENLKYALVTNDKSPLRSTPLDSGINRIAHLQKNMPLVIDGEKGNFYRVILGSQKTGWIWKGNVKLEESGESLAELKGYDYIDSDEFFIFVFHLDKMTPFELVESSPFLIKFYNVKNYPDNTYVMDFPVEKSMQKGKLLGYSGQFSGTDFILKIRKPVITDEKQPLKNIRIAVDAGHGGSERGTTGCLGDREKDVMLEYAKLLEHELKKRGADVIMTRKGDDYKDLNERVELANSENALFFISLHGNALPDGKDPNANSGTGIYYYYNQAKPLADDIIKEMTSQLGMKNDKVRQQSFAVVRNTNALSILIEIGYMINPSDNAKMINKDFQKKTAKAIADGIENFLKN